MNDIHSLYAGIVSVNAGTNAMLKEHFQRMCRQLCHGAGLNIGGQTGFNTNLLLGEQIRQAQINGLEMAFLSAEEKRALREKVAAK